MFAIIETGSKQYKVQIGTILDIEKIETNNNSVFFEQVLLINDDKQILIGKPYVEKAQVKAELVKDFKDKKVIVFKFKRKTGYKKTLGHRQNLTRVKITDIVMPGKTTSAKKVAEDNEEPVITKE